MPQIFIDKIIKLNLMTHLRLEDFITWFIQYFTDGVVISSFAAKLVLHTILTRDRVRVPRQFVTRHAYFSVQETNLVVALQISSKFLFYKLQYRFFFRMV